MDLAAEITTKKIRKRQFAPEITLAQNEDGEEIGELTKINGCNFDLDWSDIYPYWLIARHEDEIIGAIQVLPGKPVGRIEMLTVKQSLDTMQRANVCWRLYVTAVSMLRAQGSQLVSSIVLFANKSVKKALKKRGAKTDGQGNIMIMRIN